MGVVVTAQPVEERLGRFEGVGTAKESHRASRAEWKVELRRRAQGGRRSQIDPRLLVAPDIDVAVDATGRCRAASSASRCCSPSDISSTCQARVRARGQRQGRPRDPRGGRGRSLASPERGRGASRPALRGRAPPWPRPRSRRSRLSSRRPGSHRRTSRGHGTRAAARQRAPGRRERSQVGFDEHHQTLIATDPRCALWAITASPMFRPSNNGPVLWQRRLASARSRSHPEILENRELLLPRSSRRPSRSTRSWTASASARSSGPSPRARRPSAASPPPLR